MFDHVSFPFPSKHLPDLHDRMTKYSYSTSSIPPSLLTQSTVASYDRMTKKPSDASDHSDMLVGKKGG